MSILDPSYMIDLGGIDVIQSQGVAIPGLYQKLLDNIGPCGNPLIYNWKFNGVFIPPQYVEPILEDDAIYINDIYVSSDDVVHIPTIAPQPAVVQLNVLENGEYEAPAGVDGFNPVIVNVAGILSGKSEPDASLGRDGEVYRRVFTIPDDVNFVEYLESTGTQYINTGIYATQDIDAIVTGDRKRGDSSIGCMLGVRSGDFGNMSNSIYFGSHGDSSTAISAIKTHTINGGTVVDVPGVSTRRTITVKDNSGYYVYLSTIDEKPTYSKLYRQSGEWQSTMPLCMFAFYSGTTLNRGSGARVYRVTILDKNIPIADYLPCLDGNGVACMWDNISEEYVYNNGTGAFLYGNSANPDQLSDVYYTKVNGIWKAI